MSAQIQNLEHCKFCEYHCGAYIGFSNGHLSKDRKKHQPIEAKTGKIHECPKRGWSESVSCYGCEKQIIFHNSQKSELSGKKSQFDSPGNRHNCEKFTGGKN